MTVSQVAGSYAPIPAASGIYRSLIFRTSPPVAAVFVMGILSKRGNDRVALSTLIFGLLAGSVVFCFDFAPISGFKYVTDGLVSGGPLWRRSITWLDYRFFIIGFGRFRFSEVSVC